MAKITPEIVVKAFMSTKDDIEDLKGKIKQLEEVQGKRLTWMQTFLQKTGQLSSKTPFGTFVKKEQIVRSCSRLDSSAQLDHREWEMGISELRRKQNSRP